MTERGQMDGATLVTFPLPMLLALLCGVLAALVWRLDLGCARASAMLSAVFALATVQALLVGVRFGYGMTSLIPLQRTLPMLFGPALYLGFAALTIDRRVFVRRTLAHVTAPAVALGMVWLVVGDLRVLDLMIGASYLFYALALVALWRKGPDALIHARVDLTGRLSNWILRAAGLLVFVLGLDTWIALDFAFNRGANAPTLISYGTVPLIVLLFALLITLPAMLERSGKPVPPVSEPTQDDASVEGKLRDLMEEERVFLDPDLTVQRLAKRLHLPARDLSGAINRTQAMNVSQYVNTFRLNHAARLLVDSDESVTKIAERSGFMTRSNFYREFQRVHGQSPTAFRRASRGAKNAAQ